MSSNTRVGYGLVALGVAWCAYGITSLVVIRSSPFWIVTIAGVAVVYVMSERWKVSSFTILVAFSTLLVAIAEARMWLDPVRIIFFTRSVLTRYADMRFLLREHLIVLSAMLPAYIISLRAPHSFDASGASRWCVEHKRVMLIGYVVGFGSVIYLWYVSGDLSHVADRLAYKGARAAGHGEFVVLQYFAYAAMFGWFGAHVKKAIWYRYGGLLLLSLPMLLTGSRVGVIITFLGCMRFDERFYGGMQLRFLAAGVVSVALASSVYGAIRAGGDVNHGAVEDSAFADMSMPVGFVLGEQLGFFDRDPEPEMLLSALGPYLPKVVSEWAQLGRSPNMEFTHFLYGDVASTYSFGFMGEAWWIAGAGLSWLYYAGIALLFLVGEMWKHRYVVLFGCVLSGAAIRIVKGGVAQGMANVIIISVPITVLLVVGNVVSSMRSEYVRERTDG